MVHKGKIKKLATDYADDCRTTGGFSANILINNKACCGRAGAFLKTPLREEAHG
jgi:hypothetical protein